MQRCLERQICKKGDEKIVIDCSIVPENPLSSSLFKINTIWTLESKNGTTSNVPNQKQAEKRWCLLKVQNKLECTKKIWGLTSMVENMLETQIRQQVNVWLNIAEQTIQEHNQTIQKQKQQQEHAQHAFQNEPDPIKPKQQQLNSETKHANSHQRIKHTSSFSSSSRMSSQANGQNFVRIRLSTLKRVVHGTEKLANMFKLGEANQHSSVVDVESQVNAENLIDNKQATLTEISDNSKIESIDLDDKNVKISINERCLPKMFATNVNIEPSNTSTSTSHTTTSPYRWQMYKTRAAIVACVLVFLFFVYWVNWKVPYS